MKNKDENIPDDQHGKMIGYPMTGLLKDWMEKISNEPGGSSTVQAVLQRLNDYGGQFRAMKKLGDHAHIKAGINTLDKLHSQIPPEEMNQIRCQAGCTACCFINATITEDESALIVEHCRKNEIEIDKDYLKKQLVKGREEFSEISKCVFLKDSLCSIYEVRPAICRKHFVKSDPILCDSSVPHSSNPDSVFDIQSEIVTSALFTISDKGPIEQMILKEINRTE